jgi:hypothetical protein
VRRIAALLVSVACLIAGSLVAHALAYAMVIPDGAERARVLAETGHGYLGELPLIVAALAAIAIVGVSAEVAGGLRRQPARTIAAWPFALTAPLGFALQEHLERFLANGHWPWTAALDPTFSPGLALQLPFAWLAWRVARLLLRGAQAVERRLVRRRQGVRIAPAPRRAPAIGRVWTPRRQLLSSCAAGRAPPGAASRA